MSTKKALIVDGSYTMRNMVSLSLKGENFEVMEAGDGDEAIDIAKNSDKFDVIITDINMPNMSGIELIKNLRKDSKFKFTPILVLTTEGGDDKKQEGKDAGATGWVVKPFNPDVLISAIKKVCIEN